MGRYDVHRWKREATTIERGGEGREERGEERIVSQLNYSHSRGPHLLPVGASSIPLLLVVV